MSSPQQNDKMAAARAIIDKVRIEEKAKADSTNNIHSQVFINFFGFWVYTTILIFIGIAVFIGVPEGNQRIMDLASGALISNALPLVLTWAFRTTKSAVIDKMLQNKKEEKK